MAEPITRWEVTWCVRKGAQGDLKPLRILFEEEYDEYKARLQDWLCLYFSGGECNSKGLNISPMGALPDGGKVLKARWAYPGSGKSGGLRLLLAAYCQVRRVDVVACWLRRDDPSDDDIARALSR